MTSNNESVLNYLKNEITELERCVKDPKWESTASLNHKKGQIEALKKAVYVLENGTDLYTL